MAVTLGKLVLMLASYFGWWHWCRKKWDLDVHFVPALVAAGQFCVLFLPGLLNFLPEAAWGLYLGGLILAAKGLKEEKLGAAKPWLTPGTVAVAIFLGLTVLAVRGKVVTWFDNFTHWAVVVKNMLDADRFPTFAQKAVGFTSYPLGSSAMIWYFCRFVSREEDIQMLAQCFHMLCAVLPLLGMGKKKSWSGTVFFLVFVNFLLLRNIPLTELLVDTLMPLAAGALFLTVWKLVFQEKRSAWFAFPLAFWMVSIKGSGMLLAAAALAWLLWGLKRQGRNLREGLGACLLLALCWWLWNKHCDYVFLNAATSQHAVSGEYFAARLAEKTPEMIGDILKNAAIFLFTRKEVLWLLGSLTVLGLCARGHGREYGKFALFCIGIYIVYAASLGGMYVLSMSAQGALELQSIERYALTMDIFLYLLMGGYGLNLWGSGGKGPVGLVLAALALGNWAVAGELATPFSGEYDPQQRLAIEEVLEEYGVSGDFSYLVLDDTEAVQYAAYVCRMHLDTDRVTQLHITDESKMAQAENYDYLIILDTDNPIIQDWVARNRPDQAGERVVRHVR